MFFAGVPLAANQPVVGECGLIPGTLVGGAPTGPRLASPLVALLCCYCGIASLLCHSCIVSIKDLAS